MSKVVEGLVIGHLLMNKETPFLKTAKTFLWNYYDKTGREIDAVFKEDGGYSGIEVKYSGQVNEKDIRAKVPVRKYIILSKDDVGGNDKMMIVPVDIFLALLLPSERNI